MTTRLPPTIRLERLRNTPVWTPFLPARSAKPASAPAVEASKERLTGGGTTISVKTLSGEGRPSTSAPATKAYLYKHHRADKASFHRPGRLEALGVGGARTITLGGGSALSFKLWSESPVVWTPVRNAGGGRFVGVGDDSAATATATRGNNVEKDQSSIGNVIGDTCYTPSGGAIRGPALTPPASALVERERAAGTTGAVVAPASDFGVTTAVSRLGTGSCGGSVGSAANTTPAPLAPQTRPGGRLLYALVQLSTRWAHSWFRVRERMSVARRGCWDDSTSPGGGNVTLFEATVDFQGVTMFDFVRRRMSKGPSGYQGGASCSHHRTCAESLCDGRQRQHL